jgi:small subunit ribosomal protein S2
MFIVDISKEHIAVREANRLNIPVFGIVDTNSDPNLIDFPIPANDDASKSISLIIDVVSQAIVEGLEERKLEREKEGVVKEKEKKAGDDDKKLVKKKTSAKKVVIEEDIEEEEEVDEEELEDDDETEDDDEVANEIESEEDSENEKE